MDLNKSFQKKKSIMRLKEQMLDQEKKSYK